MKRDRNFGSSDASASLLPVLHFKGTAERDRFVSALNAVSTGETALADLFGSDIQELENLSLFNYEIYGATETKRFACLLCAATMDSLCSSAKFYNGLFKSFGLGREMKTLMSIDHSNAHARLNVGRVQHSDQCCYPSNVTAVLRYMELEPHDIPSVQNLKDACFQRIVVSENPLRQEAQQYFAVPAWEQLEQFAREFLGDPTGPSTPAFVQITRVFDPNDMSVMPRARAPEAPVHETLNDSWEQLLKPKEDLVEAEGDKDACGCCRHYKKTIVMIPCGHMFYCDECFRGMMKSTTLQKQCAECRKEFKSVQRVFW